MGISWLQVPLQPCWRTKNQAYCRTLEIRIRISSSPHTFIFGYGIHKIIGSLIISISLPISLSFIFKTYIVPLYLPLLIGRKTYLHSNLVLKKHN